jgi:hypothetical protein
MSSECDVTIQSLLQQSDRLGELVPRAPGDPAIKAQIEVLPLSDSDMARCLRAGLYLRFNFLDESHTVAQGIHTVEGSYWHAIMHRREPDYSNAKYWYRRVGQHAVLQVLPDGDPFAFVDFCEQAERDPSRYKRAVEVQRAEWEALFQYCRAATSS